jgi:molybdopterin/thiamine biosynthesis adenylyltransferase
MSNEKKRYNRQLILGCFSDSTQKQLKHSAVLVAGIGGLGGAAAQYLAAAGIGKLIIVHSGILEHEDMNRQILMSSNEIGTTRVTVAKKRLMEINPDTEVYAVDKWITSEIMNELIIKADIVLDCRHNFEERHIINKVCVDTRKRLVEGAMDEMFGYVTSIVPKVTPCLACLYPENPPWNPYGFGVLGAIPGMLGSFMALEAIKIITDLGKPLYSTLLTFEGLEGEFRKYSIKRDPACRVCGSSNDSK